MSDEADRPFSAAGEDFPGFQDLMPWRVQDILLVSSLYDSFTLQEDGRLNELILSEFLDLNLHATPGITHVSSGDEALALARDQSRFNLIISTPNPAGMDAAQLARAVRQAGLGVPVVVLAYDHRELKDFEARHPDSAVDRTFMWQGDARILIAIVKQVEDQRNVAHDTRRTGVKVILLVEDSVRYYSSFLPVIYNELIAQSSRLISEGVNLSHKLVRLRARPKILLCSTFEEAWESFTRYRPHVLGIISDIEFPRRGGLHPEAGFDLVRMAREATPDLAVVLQSSRPENAGRALAAGASFLLKGSPTLLSDLRRFMIEQFAFGDFVFRLRSGHEVDRAIDLKSLEEKLHTVPAESIGFHGERNHFSNWLTARTEFALAHRLRPRKVSDYATLEDLRRDLITSIAGYRREQEDERVGDFDRFHFDPGANFFARIGGGSLGGKARGLAFARWLLARHRAVRVPGVHVAVPRAVVLGTDVFDRFLEENDLLDFAMSCDDDAAILERFLEARIPEDAVLDLAAFLEAVRWPLAVRSSSLLEDSQYQPFTGVYETFMLANNHPVLSQRLHQLLAAIKRVYASTFSRQAKAYLRATPYRLEEEKMGVILQRVVGAPHGRRYYPDFSGVARSWNFYPTAPLKPDDGVAAVALGLGRSVVEGENCLTFCPRYPRHLMQFSSVEDILNNSQREFWALELGHADAALDAESSIREARFDLATAEADGTLYALGSTWSAENNAVYDGLSRPGVRLVSFAPILKHQVFPLPELLSLLLAMAERGLTRPAEIEFAVRLGASPGEPHEFGFLQMRPLVLAREGETLEIEDVEPSRLLCRSRMVMGNGTIDGLRDVVVVDFHHFDRSHSRQAAHAVGRFNAQLAAEGRPYLLIGVGRWGSTDPWLGIPVTWDQISGARAIVETGFRDIRVTPSQGSHFFQNLSSFQIGYFTVNPEAGDGFVDWDWIESQPPLAQEDAVRHLRLERPIVVRMNGARSEGVIFKPDGEESAIAD